MNLRSINIIFHADVSCIFWFPIFVATGATSHASLGCKARIDMSKYMKWIYTQGQLRQLVEPQLVDGWLLDQMTSTVASKSNGLIPSLCSSTSIASCSLDSKRKRGMEQARDGAGKRWKQWTRDWMILSSLQRVHELLWSKGSTPVNKRGACTPESLIFCSSLFSLGLPTIDPAVGDGELCGRALYMQKKVSGYTAAISS